MRKPGRRSKLHLNYVDFLAYNNQSFQDLVRMNIRKRFSQLGFTVGRHSWLLRKLRIQSKPNSVSHQRGSLGANSDSKNLLREFESRSSLTKIRSTGIIIEKTVIEALCVINVFIRLLFSSQSRLNIVDVLKV